MLWIHFFNRTESSRFLASTDQKSKLTTTLLPWRVHCQILRHQVQREHRILKEVPQISLGGIAFPKILILAMIPSWLLQHQCPPLLPATRCGRTAIESFWILSSSKLKVPPVCREKEHLSLHLMLLIALLTVILRLSLVSLERNISWSAQPASYLWVGISHIISTVYKLLTRQRYMSFCGIFPFLTSIWAAGNRPSGRGSPSIASIPPGKMEWFGNSRHRLLRRRERLN